MPIFKYKAMNSSGREVNSEIVAASGEDAIGQIRAKGLFPTSVKHKSSQPPENVVRTSKGKLRVPVDPSEGDHFPQAERRSISINFPTSAVPYMLIMFVLGAIFGFVVGHVVH